MRRVGKKKATRKGSFRSIHISDIHLSNSLPHSKATESNGMTNRLIDQEKLMYRVFDTARSERCEAIFIQGDLLDHSKADAITLTMMARSLSKTPVPLYVIGGNHDGVNTRGERFTVELLSEIKGCHYMETGEVFSPLPWLDFWPMEFAPLDRNREMLSRMKLKKSHVNTLLMHNSVSGCTHGGWQCEEGQGFDGDEVTARFDHVLSGHFHDPQEFGTSGRYLGAPLHLNAGDAGRDAGYWIMDWLPDGSREETFVDGGAPRFHLLDMADLLKLHSIEEYGELNDEQVSKDDFIRIKLKCTQAELVARKPVVEKFVEDLCADGFRASWFHDPVYHHTSRLSGSEDGSFGVMSTNKMISSYVGNAEVNTVGLDSKVLRAVGRDILKAVEGNWNE